MKNIILYIIVFICGGVVLAVEITGTRIIGPFYGVSLFLWSALISVTLIALSVGYMIGGRIADKWKSYNVLSLIIAIPGILILLLPLYRNSVIELTWNMELRIAVLISSFILFFLPLTFLGMVSPYAIKLRTETLEKVGTRAGDLYAVSTIGSVVAALLTGFILIPVIGIVKLTTGIGILLLFTSLLSFITGKKIITQTASVIVIIFIALISVYLIPSEKTNLSENIIAAEQSEYAEIKVMDIDNTRLFLIDGGIHSAIDKANGENVLAYVWVLESLKNVKDYAGDMLLIGLGGGSILKSFYADNWDVEVVEIDPLVTETAHKYFGLEPSAGKIIHMDGREFLNNTERSYDVIMLDAFGSGSIPFHLVTQESFETAKKRLNKEGIFTINLECQGWKDIIVRSVSSTLRESFSNVTIFPVVEPPDQLGNVIIMASDSPIKLIRELERDYTDPDYRFSAQYERAHAWDNSFETTSDEGIILTDDLNPVDIWSDRINRASRIDLHNSLGESPFSW